MARETPTRHGEHLIQPEGARPLPEGSPEAPTYHGREHRPDYRPADTRAATAEDIKLEEMDAHTPERRPPLPRNKRRATYLFLAVITVIGLVVTGLLLYYGGPQALGIAAVVTGLYLLPWLVVLLPGLLRAEEEREVEETVVREIERPGHP